MVTGTTRFIRHRELDHVIFAQFLKLSPRLRQTLAYLLEGDSEKQVADRLRLSHDTTHQYVTALYRHFGVGSRAQLMAHVLKRIGRGQWGRFLPEIARTVSLESGSRAASV